MIPRVTTVALVLAACYIFRLVVYFINLIKLDFKVRAFHKAQETQLPQIRELLAEEDEDAAGQELLETFYCEQCFRFSKIGPECEWCFANQPIHPLFLTLTLEEHHMKHRFPPAKERARR